MTDAANPFAGMSPERRRLLELKLRARQAAAAGSELRPVPRPDGTAPLSAMQARLWVLDRMHPGAVYTVPFAALIRGPLDVDALRRAIDLLVERHETLRTTFEERDGAPVQVIHPPAPVPLSVVALSTLSENDKEAGVRQRVDEDANTSFDLRAGPVFRASLLRLADDEHVLLLCAHHIASDGWSLGVMAGEVGEAYAAFADGREPALPPLPVSYADFAAWQREHLSGERLERLTSFWRTALEGAPPSLDLPADHARPAGGSFAGRVLRSRIDGELVERLEDVARREDATLFHVLLAAFRATLARRAGQGDVVIGTPVANRPRSAVEGLVGFFVNSVPLRGSVDSDATFAEMIRAEKAATLAAFDHAELPFDRMVDELRIARDPARNPVFQVMLALQTARMDPLVIPGAVVTPVAAEMRVSRFDLTLDLWPEDDGGVRVNAEFATDVYDAASIDRLVRDLVALLSAAADEPDARLSDLHAAATADELPRIRDLGRPAVEMQAGETLHGILAGHAQATPDAPAIAWDGGVLTWGEMDALAASLASRLRALGVGRERVVGMMLPSSPEGIVAILGILKAGGAYLPLDPAYPDARIAHMLADSGAVAVVGRSVDLLRIDRLPTVAVDGFASFASDGESADDALSIDSGPENLAYVIYTSGSTGVPKGVGVTHGVAAAHARAVARLYGFGSRDRTLAFSPFTFDPSVEQIFGTFAGGGCVVPRGDDVWSAAELAERVERLDVTVLHGTTGYFAQVAHDARALAALKPRLRWLGVGGEELRPETVAAWHAAPGAAALLHLYGPTEAVVAAAWYPVPDGFADDRPARVPIGRALPGRELRVLDDAGREVGIGVPGELCIGGEALARGYVGRPALTAQRFVPDLAAAHPGARIYRTGDRARWREDGTLEFLGRADAQVKVRGFRVELGEVESALRAHPSVAGCAVDARPDATGTHRLIAWFVAHDGALTDDADLRAHLAARLPEHMVPAAFVQVGALPLTAHGKVNRAALPEPSHLADADAYVAPATADEQTLAAIWAELLGADRVGVEDEFVSLGGHSLLAARVVSRISATLGVAIPLRAVFETPTIRALARRIEQARRESTESAAHIANAPIARADRSRPLPASFAQERMWFLQQLDPDSAAYNVASALRLRGPVDADALRRALAEVVARHEALRTVLAPGDGGPVQVIQPADAFGWTFTDLSHLPITEAHPEATRLVGEDARTPVDLARGPVLRAQLIRIAADECVLSFVMHHAATDAWSWDVLNGELSAAYEAIRRGEAPELAPLDVQYADYAAWQRKSLTGEVMETQAAFWRRALEGAPALLELPTDRPRPAVQDLGGSVNSFRVPAEVANAARALAAAEGATPFMVLLAAFDVVLARWSGAEDIVVGSPVAHRPRPELEPLIGFFSNTLPLRADLRGDPSFRELIRRVKDSTLAAYAHQDLPFERLVDEVKAPRSLAHTPLFQVMFTLAPQPAGLTMEGVQAFDAFAETGTSRYDLTLILTETEHGALSGYAEYATALWDCETIRGLTNHLTEALRSATASPDERISRLEILPDVEREVLRDFNATDVQGGETIVHRLVERQAMRTPDAAAVELAGERLTYAELDARANRLANRLVRLGVRPDARVAVAFERSVEMVVAVLAVLKAGGCYVAVDPRYPADRIAYMLADSAAAVVLTTSDVAARLPSTDATIVSVDADAALIAAESADAPAIDVDGENLLYVLYTSGSTGRPKGAALPHRALANLVRWQVERWGGYVAVRTLQFASLSFDVSFQEIFATWAAGGTLVLVDDDTRRDGEALLAYLRAHRIERLFLPFAALQNLAEVAESADARLPDLREIVTAGEALRSTPQLRAFFRANPGCRLENQYGPSETHVVTAHRLSDEPDVWPALPPIGKPVANTRMYVLDAQMQPSPIGVPGELYAAGANLARGYLARPSLTAERFVPDPFSGDGGRLYRTGDRARWTAFGELEYVGRTDFQVKVRGFRVEPGEVEAVLTEHPSVVQAAVVAHGEGQARRLAAYVVASADATVSTAELRAHVAGRLPEHMVPGAWRVMDGLPLTPSGKVDRRALPEPDVLAATADEARVEPRTPAEQMVADAWAEVLGVHPGAHDDFFALGGHSLAATRVVARIRRGFGIDLPLRALFEAPTVAGLAARAQEARRGGHVALPPLVATNRTDDAPLSFAQQRFWFVEHMGAAGAAYHIPLAITLRGPLNVGALRSALDGLVARHEALRTTFHLRGAEPVQTVAPEASVHLALHDLTELSGDARLAQADRIARDEWVAPFDLAHGPLMRARLVRLQADKHRLLLTFHHIVCDAWSLGVAFRELGELYAAAVDARPAALPPLAAQYADYAAWQRERLTGEALAGELAFWRERLEGAAVLQLPTDRPRPAVQSFRGAIHPFRIDRQTAERVDEIARREGATPFMVLLAAWNVLLSRWSGTEDVVVGSPVAGRVPQETEAMVGVFVNTLALRTDLTGAPSFADVLARVREATLDAYAHQDVPFERLVEELKVERSLDRHPLFQVIFNMQAGGYGAPELPGLSVAVEEGDTGAAKVDLVLGIVPDGDGFAADLQYASDLFDEATIGRMASHLRVLLDAALAEPARRIEELPLMPADEAALLESFHGTPAAYPTDATIPALFDAQARRTPDAIAVRWNGEATTYAEMDERANRLANHLRALGVGPEVRVAVCMERTPELIVALLAVLKAGGGYVPVDPAYPADRIAYMLADCGARVLLTHDRLTDRLPTTSATLVRVDADWPTIVAESAEAPSIEADAANLAYVIYTSGSTGRPKGVQITHASAAVLLHWLREHVSDDERRPVLGSTSVSFDVSIAEIFGTLCWGGTLVLMRDALALAEASEEVVLASMAPSAAAELLRMGAIPPSLKVLNLGGEALPASLAQGLHALGTVERIGNFYGPTEDTTYSTWSIVGRDDARVYVGRPIARTRAYVLDRALRPAPLGVPGELYLAGAGLARGYHGRPALTAERFVPDPFSPVPGARMYRVGDLVRWRVDGQLEYLGRLDHQVKIRGHRVETGEIESVLREHPAVRDAAVIAREDVPGDVRLVAYVVSTDPADAPDAAELRGFLKQRLPEYMVPAAWVPLDALPLSPNGKVDRPRLPAPGEHERAAARESRPRTAMEESIARVWEEVLALPHVGLDESFFEIGGHSLILARLQQRLREAIGLDVSVVDVFQHPTVAALAAHLAPDPVDDEAEETPKHARGQGSRRREMMRRTRR